MRGRLKFLWLIWGANKAGCLFCGQDRWSQEGRALFQVGTSRLELDRPNVCFGYLWMLSSLSPSVKHARVLTCWEQITNYQRLLRDLFFLAQWMRCMWIWEPNWETPDHLLPAPALIATGHGLVLSVHCCSPTCCRWTHHGHAISWWFPLNATVYCAISWIETFISSIEYLEYIQLTSININSIYKHSVLHAMVQRLSHQPANSDFGWQSWREVQE